MSNLIDEDYNDYNDDYMLNCLTKKIIINNNDNKDDEDDDRDDYIYRLLNEYTPIKLWIHKWYSVIPFN